MNNYILIGAAVAVVAAVGLGAFAMMQSDTNMPSSQDTKEILSNVKDDVVNADADLGYGQVTKEEGAYTP